MDKDLKKKGLKALEGAAVELLESGNIDHNFYEGIKNAETLDIDEIEKIAKVLEILPKETVYASYAGVLYSMCNGDVLEAIKYIKAMKKLHVKASKRFNK